MINQQGKKTQCSALAEPYNPETSFFVNLYKRSLSHVFNHAKPHKDIIEKD